MNQYFILFSLGFFTFFSSTLGLSSVQSVQPFIMTNATTCPTCLVVKTSISIQNTFPWLFNNPNTRFFYTKTDSRGWPIYQHISGQNILYYLHFYDEGIFYNGFYVINDLETGYVESDGLSTNTYLVRIFSITCTFMMREFSIMASMLSTILKLAMLKVMDVCLYTTLTLMTVLMILEGIGTTG